MAASSSATRMLPCALMPSRPLTFRILPLPAPGRHQDAERSAAGGGIAFDNASVGAHDLRYQGQAQPGAILLRRDERVEDNRLNIFRHVRPVGMHAELHRQ